jgi:hypothetical protein
MEDVPFDDLGSEEPLTRIARKRPHGVYRTRWGKDDFGLDHGAFSGDTMIQVLERAAHELDSCLKGTSEDLRATAKELRSAPR